MNGKLIEHCQPGRANCPPGYIVDRCTTGASGREPGHICAPTPKTTCSFNNKTFWLDRTQKCLPIESKGCLTLSGYTGLAHNMRTGVCTASAGDVGFSINNALCKVKNQVFDVYRQMCVDNK